jgi:tetratricopeptide (TPR) repeat protein
LIVQSDVPEYLTGLTDEIAHWLMRLNAPGVQALWSYLRSDNAVAFLGAGCSTPLYPLWAGVTSELINAALDNGMEPAYAATLQARAGQEADAVMEAVRTRLSEVRYRAALRALFGVRRDQVSGKSWTPVHELVCRCAFKGVVTTNYDSGILDARMHVRPSAADTGFTCWNDEASLERWLSGDVFGDAELPVLFAHGHHNQPDTMVLATRDYRRAYAGNLSRVVGRMVDSWHLVWLGFSFTDPRIAAVLREVGEYSGTRIDPGLAPRHIAVMGWDPDDGDHPEALQELVRIQYAADLILYPTARGDHSPLRALLKKFTDPGYQPRPAIVAPSIATAFKARASRSTDTTRIVGSPERPAIRRATDVEAVPHFTGRVAELDKLDRWAADPAVRLIGVTAWGGAGKTALVAEWVELGSRPGLRGVFEWSFYTDPSAERWAQTLLDCGSDLGVPVVGTGPLPDRVLRLLATIPVLLVLDGLEVRQEGPEGSRFGWLLDGLLRDVLTGACRMEQAGLVLLTSRFPFADLESFDGTAARMLELPPFTPAEGASLLVAAGGDWLTETERRDLAAGVDGHALAIAVLGGLLTERPPTHELRAFRAELDAAVGMNSRVAKVLRFYSSRLPEADRYLLAAIALFARPVSPESVLVVAENAVFANRLDGWDPPRVRAAALGRLAGLLSWHTDGTVSAHPLVRDTFRPLAMGAAEVASSVALTGLPAGTIAGPEDGLRVVEAIELLVEANRWTSAHDLYTNRTDTGRAWRSLPTGRLGQRAAIAFVATPDRKQRCRDQLSLDDLRFYLNEVGLSALIGADLLTAEEYLNAAIGLGREVADVSNLPVNLRNLAECLGQLGEVEQARQAAVESSSRHDTDTEVCLAWLCMLAGQTIKADEHFMTASRNEYARDRRYLNGIRGVRLADFLIRTGRIDPARRLTELNLNVCRRYGWNDEVARCQRLLGMLDLAAGQTTSASRHLTRAAAAFRAGDHLVDLSETLPILANCARAAGELDAADRHATDALRIAAPRRLCLSQVAALTARAHAYADRGIADGGSIVAGRDAADAVTRIALRHHLRWAELDALDAHVHLDRVERVDHGHSADRDSLRAELIPATLHSDPLSELRTTDPGLSQFG